MAFPCIFMINDANGDAHTESLKGALALVLRKETSDVDAWRPKFSRLVGFTRRVIELLMASIIEKSRRGSRKRGQKIGSRGDRSYRHHPKRLGKKTEEEYILWTKRDRN